MLACEILKKSPLQWFMDAWAKDWPDQPTPPPGGGGGGGYALHPQSHT